MPPSKKEQNCQNWGIMGKSWWVFKEANFTKFQNQWGNLNDAFHIICEVKSFAIDTISISGAEILDQICSTLQVAFCFCGCSEAFVMTNNIDSECGNCIVTLSMRKSLVNLSNEESCFSLRLSSKSEMWSPGSPDCKTHSARQHHIANQDPPRLH